VAIKVDGVCPLRIFLIYRPPPSTSNGLTASVFLDEVETYLTDLCTTVRGNLCIVGDFNLHWEKASDPTSARFRRILDNLDLMQLVSLPTHKSGHTLDLVLVHKDKCDMVDIKEVVDPCLSDHSLVLGSVKMRPSRTQVRQIACRPLKRVNTGDFAADLEAGLQSIQDMNDVEDLVLKYQELTQNVTEQHAPMRTINLKGIDVKAWYDDEIHEARKERRRRERKYRKTELEVHKLYLAEQAEKVVQLVKAKKRHFYTTTNSPMQMPKNRFV
jgi:hypothetical protein